MEDGVNSVATASQTPEQMSEAEDDLGTQLVQRWCAGIMAEGFPSLPNDVDAPTVVDEDCVAVGGRQRHCKGQAKDAD